MAKQGNMHEKYIVSPRVVRRDSEMKHHPDNAPGLRYVFLEKDMLSVTSLYTSIRVVKDLLPSEATTTSSHIHNCDSVYLLIGDNEDLTGLKSEVTMEGEKYTVSSPASVFIPKGVSHSSRVLSGSGKYILIVLNPVYNKSLV